MPKGRPLPYTAAFTRRGFFPLVAKKNIKIKDSLADLSERRQTECFDRISKDIKVRQ